MSKTLILALGLAFLGCGKKADGTKADDKAMADKTGDKSMDDKKMDDKKPSGGGGVSSDDEYISKGKVQMQKMVDIFKADGKDCDKLAGDMDKLVSSDDMQAIQAYEKAHPDVKKKADEATKDFQKQFEEAAMPAMQACASNQKLQDVFKKME